MNMKQQEIISAEQRDSANLYELHLYADGDWWRAYEWSAYMCHNYASHLKENERLSITHRHLKDTENGIIYVGLKLTSFDKYLPNVKGTEKLKQIDAKHIVIDVREIFQSEINIENYSEIFTSWKNNVPYKDEQSKQAMTNKTVATDTATLKSVMQQILAYPLERKTMVENTMFISLLKEELVKIL